MNVVGHKKASSENHVVPSSVDLRLGQDLSGRSREVRSGGVSLFPKQSDFYRFSS